MRLRQFVLSNRACLATVAPGEAYLLVLRAGLDRSSPRSAAAVARILGVSTAREAELERSALSAFTSQAQGGCPATTTTVISSFAFAAGAVLVSTTGQTGTALLAVSRTLAVTGSEQHRVLAATATRRPNSNSLNSAAMPSAAVGGERALDSGGTSPLLLILLATAAAGGLGLMVASRRFRAKAPADGAPEPAVPAPTEAAPVAAAPWTVFAAGMAPTRPKPSEPAKPESGTPAPQPADAPTPQRAPAPSPDRSAGAQPLQSAPTGEPAAPRQMPGKSAPRRRRRGGLVGAASVGAQRALGWTRRRVGGR